MVFILETAKEGDILLYRSEKGNIIGNLIQFFSAGGKYSHAALYLGNGRILESHLKTGVIEKELNPKWYDLIDVYYYNKGGLTKEEIQNIIKYGKTKIGVGYDALAFPATFLRSTLGKIFGFSNFRKDKPILNNANTYYCSEYVAECYYVGGGINICPKVHYQSATPSDLGRSKVLKKGANSNE